MHKLLLLFVALSFGTYGQIDEVRRITKQLCSPDFHGRGYVHKGDSLAANFLAVEFQKIGVEPIKKSYFQPFEMSVNCFPGAMEVLYDGKTLVPGKDFVVDPSSSGGNLGVKAFKIPKDKVLDVEYIREKIGQAVKGSKFNCLVFHLGELSGDTLKQARGFSREVAAIVPVIEAVNDKFTWSVSQEQNPRIYLQMQDSIIDWNNLEFEVNIQAKHIPTYQSQNVVAYIPSKKMCAKTIVFTAHYDHLGRMGTDTYFPGANDNASGTAMLLTMARYFKENPSQYNIMFIAFAGEEAGLLGSKYYVEHPMSKLKKIKFLINLDIMGSGEEGITAVNATLFEEEFALLQKINEEKNLLTLVKRRGPAQNSDHYWFTEKGVPAFFIYTMGPNKHYHDVFDRYEELSFKEYDDITTLLIEFVNRLK